MFKIGSQVWIASCNWSKKTMTCPDCRGNKYLIVILGNRERITVECTECKSGYESSRGYVYYYDYIPFTEPITIEKIEIEIAGGKEVYEYQYRCHIYKSADTFSTREAAMIRAEEMRKELVQKQKDQMRQKDKPTRSWAWNATYHRGQVRQAEKDLEYHRSMLDYANAHAKTDEKEQP